MATDIWLISYMGY